MPAAPQPWSQEEILEAALAALTDEDVPPTDEDLYGWPDPDTGRPVELAGLDGAELEKFLVGPSAALAGASASGGRMEGPEVDRLAEASALGRLVEGSEPGGWLPRDGSGGGAGFADSGVLDVLAAGLPLAGFADDAHARLAEVTDDELVGVLRAWRRVASWAAARELAAVAELARRRPAQDTLQAPPGRLPLNLSEFIPDEVAAALTLTGHAAQDEVNLALDLAGPLQATAEALAAGWIDLPRAKIIAAGVATLSAAHAAAVQAAVLPGAPDLTTGQLRRATARAVLAADPDAARKQREEDLQNARVDCWPDPAGTASLAGYHLPAAKVLAADARLTRIARQWQKQGAGGGLDLLRAWAYLALLLGHDPASPPPSLLPADASDQAPGPDARPRRSGDGPGPDARPRHSGDGPGPDGSPGHMTDGANADGANADGANGTGLRADSALAPLGQRRPRTDDEAVLPPLAGSVNLTVPLTTLLGLNDAPGAAAGYGPVDPDTARALACAAAGHRATRWHVTVTGSAGRVLGHGTAVRRTLAVGGQDGPDGRGRSLGESDSGWTVTITAEPIAAGRCDHRNAEPGYRPSAALQRLIRDRSTTCSYHGCGRPAARCDLDHTIPHDDGGITCECNLAPLCRRHHRLKQAKNWKLEQPSPGVMAWLTPAGRRYMTLPSQHPT